MKYYVITIVYVQQNIGILTYKLVTHFRAVEGLKKTYLSY